MARASRSKAFGCHLASERRARALAHDGGRDDHGAHVVQGRIGASPDEELAEHDSEAKHVPRAALTLGGVKWGGSYYGFVSEENLNLFAAQPSDYFNLVMNNVKASPPLVGVLGLRKELPACDADEALAIVETPIAREFGTQTPTHFCEKRIDVEYEWNEWALRRKALRLANLRQCVTKSSQSVVSQFRRTSETQVYLPKDQSTQYAVTKGQSMVHPLRYIAGLRGAPDTRMEVVDVGLDMGQPHEL